MTLADFEESLTTSDAVASVSSERVSIARERLLAWHEFIQERATQRWGPWRPAFKRFSATKATYGDPKLRQAQTSAHYARAVAEAARAPVKRVARILERKESQVRDDLHDARLAGFLTSTRQGRAAGTLTPAAIAILEAADTPS
jgi:hypothetical protein